HGNEWLFVSFEGVVHPVDVSGTPLRAGETWPLLSDDEKNAGWRIGGGQHLAIHTPSGRLYVLMHKGGPDTHKDPGTEVWVYDVAAHRRLLRIPVLNPLVSFMSQQMTLARRGRAGRFADWLLAKMLPNTGVERILVTQDERPVLVASASLP